MGYFERLDLGISLGSTASNFENRHGATLL
jgi:hypothetical protein